MEQLLTLLTTVTLLLIPSLVASDDQGAAEGTNAQAISGNSGSSSGVGSDNLLLVRRYVPRFIGKRDEADADIETFENTDKTQHAISLLDEYLENLLEYYDDVHLNDLETDTLDENSLSEINSGTFESVESDEIHDENSEEDDSSEISEEKRYVPSFVGKRYRTFDDDEADPLLAGKRYRPMFVGKRYRPMFIGKRYRPMFVGKRYQPKFIGKRYTPRFVGKRYTPRFVGKRYAPRFIGKRFAPKFVGKRYTPRFIGKRYTPKFVGKRFQPVFVGKKSEPTTALLDKRYTPYFVGKRNQEHVPAESSHIEKRSVSSSNDESNDATETAERSTRTKRSLSDSNDVDFKRAWGTYIPWKRSASSAYQVSNEQPSYIEKRFVAPEFIGRRDSLSTILSALDALQYARSQPRSTSKRFQAPLFIGKRASRHPMFVGKRNQIFTSEMNVPDGYREYESTPELTDVDLYVYEGYRNEQQFSPFEGIHSYSGLFPVNMELEK